MIKRRFPGAEPVMHQVLSKTKQKRHESVRVGLKQGAISTPAAPPGAFPPLLLLRSGLDSAKLIARAGAPLGSRSGS